jgi:hypothetical protein
MPPAFLAAFAEPGASVSLDEFQDWYNNEHIPLRVDHLPSFLTCARFQASDTLHPSWLALYDIDDTASLEHESYTRLRANRSPREADLLNRLEVLDRRTYELVGDENKGLTSSYHPKDPTKYIQTQGAECASVEKLKEWLGATAEGLRDVEGWTRTRIYECIDHLKTGLGVGSGEETQKAPKYLVIHEFLHPATPDLPSLKSTISKNSEQYDVQFVDERKWGLYRAYPSIAQSLDKAS